MKLYYAKGACSLAPHIILEEIGKPYEVSLVNFSENQVPEGFMEANPMGAVPVIITDKGEALTEGAVILQYLADQHPNTKLAPPAGTMERYRLMEWLNFIATEIHKGFNPLFTVEYVTKDEKAQKEIEAFATRNLAAKFDLIVKKLDSKKFLMGDQYTVADAYLFTILNWKSWFDMDLSKWPALNEYMERVKSRPATQRAMKAEGLL